MKNTNLFIKMLSANSGLSSKRFITLMAFALMAIGFIANLFWDFTIEAFIYESMQWIVIGGLGFTASERFGKKTEPIAKEPAAEEELK
jgi:hypothetical protein